MTVVMAAISFLVLVMIFGEVLIHILPLAMSQALIQFMGVLFR